MIGTANAEPIPCAYMGNTLGHAVRWLVPIGQFPAGDYNTGWLCPLSTNRGGKKLYVKGIDVFIRAAGVADYVDNIYLYGATAAANNLRQTDTTNYTTAGEKNFTFTAEDMSSYDQVHVGVDVHSTTPGNLSFFVSAVCYYDT